MPGAVRNADRMNQHGIRVLPRSESPWGNFTPQNRTYRACGKLELPIYTKLWTIFENL